ncbi:MAG: sporulation initiation phosphotransferase Spo0F [Calditrichia bacterium]
MDLTKKLLIVDDEETIRFSLSQAFITAAEEYEVSVASDALQALEKLKKYDYDLVITDIMMPGMDGFELIKKLKQYKPDIPVIVITAYGDEEKEQRSKKLGVVEYIEKPFDIHSIREKVFRLLKK